MDFLIRKESADDKFDGFAFDDIDMLVSPRDGSLIPVAVYQGVHVCQVCAEQFVEDPASPFRMVEFSCGGYGVRVGIHAKCVDKASRALQRRGDRGNQVFDMSRMHRARRFLTQATRPFRKRRAG